MAAYVTLHPPFLRKQAAALLCSGTDACLLLFGICQCLKP